MSHSGASGPSARLGANGSVSLRQLPAAVRLGSPVFSPVSTIFTLLDLSSAPIKVSEAVLEPYFTLDMFDARYGIMMSMMIA